MNYNTQLPKLIISEYGRHIQNMVEYCVSIEDREERNRTAKAIIQVMGQLNPHLRDVPDFTHKLWDHLFIISGFKLDVDSPYPKPSPEQLDTKPEQVKYPFSKIKYRHYGKIIEDIIQKANDFQEGEEKDYLKRLIATHLKKSYLNWNKDSVTDEIIFKNLEELSNGKLKMDESTKLSDASELVKRNVNKNKPHKNKGHHNKHNFKRNNKH